MIPIRLHPQKELLYEEYLLVQAWKKSASYIRYHNWFSDTLELDRAAVNLPSFLAEIRERLQTPGQWQNDPLRIVPAPKSQQWRVHTETGAWGPLKKGVTGAKLRPLAHVSLSDQVVATALMLCLADRVETLQADPRSPIHEEHMRRRIVSYGNRLLCDTIDGALVHRWGSTKLYRTYYQDYRTFLKRPEVVARGRLDDNGHQVVVVHADIRQFYDRVRPPLLADALDQLRLETDDPGFYDLLKSMFDWQWSSHDEREVGIYSQQAGLDDFKRIALPQGLVASGFFANVVLFSFDEQLRRLIGTKIEEGIQVVDACRYVDDLRITVSVEPNSHATPDECKKLISEILTRLLDQGTTGLELSAGKTKVSAFGSEERPTVRQSMRMNRIQSAVSGGFDAIGGEEILEAIKGLLRSQEALSISDDSGWDMSPVPDVGDETVARFGAARYRSTFRSMRPLLDDGVTFERSGSDVNNGRSRVARTRRELDDEARVFALGLIKRWVEDPSNVRLLRIGLDMWPEAELLKRVLVLLRPFAVVGGRRNAPKRVAWYCLGEILRAGATETGYVEDNECLPAEVNVEAYRAVLREEAIRLVALPTATIPWYLRQQALLYLAVLDPASAPLARSSTSTKIRPYQELMRFLRGERIRWKSPEFATLAVLARRAFVDQEKAIQLARQVLGPARKREIALRDPSFILELIASESDDTTFDDLTPRMREDLSMNIRSQAAGIAPLSGTVLREHPTGPIRNELGLLRFAAAFLRLWRQLDNPPVVITPGQVHLKMSDDAGIIALENIWISNSQADTTGSLYRPPSWCENHERWRFQLGYLMRFILSGQPDFTRPVRMIHWKEKESAYRPAESHWYQRLYGLFHGHQAFGDDWLPITDWVEHLLLALLRWPGCRVPEGMSWVELGIDVTIAKIEERIREITDLRGRATRVLCLPMIAKRPIEQFAERSLRGCVVQTVVPTTNDFRADDLSFSASAIRRSHRNHLSAALAAVERMLALRATHKGGGGDLDWLILPELAVHPYDVRTHLLPFARARRCIILTGLTYQQLLSGQPLVNSALWIIPEWTNANGLQITIRRQGKAHLAPNELELNSYTTLLKEFRPCQWLIGYPWSYRKKIDPVWLTAAICYDATDLGLAADLRDVSDIFAIPAFNKDIKTFDQMALALHYHMYQLVIIANNGQYGGSNAYWPRSNIHKRQVFHTHGQPQASISFFEIDDINEYLERKTSSDEQWKFPPAGLR